MKDPSQQKLDLVRCVPLYWGRPIRISKRLTYATTSCVKYETGYFFETRSLPFFPGPARLESEGLVPAYRCFGRFKRSRELRVWWAPDTGCSMQNYFLLQTTVDTIQQIQFRTRKYAASGSSVNVNPNGAMDHYSRPRCYARSPIAPSPIPTIETPAVGVLPYLTPTRPVGRDLRP